MINKSWIGLSYPLNINSNGGLSVSSGSRLTDEHILSILETKPGERVMRRDFGFQPEIFSSINPNIIDSQVEAALHKGSPGDLSTATVEGDASEGNSGIYRLQIFYGDRVLSLNLDPSS